MSITMDDLEDIFDFVISEEIDPNVKGFRGSYLPDEFKTILQATLGVGKVTPITTVYEIDNSDLLPQCIIGELMHSSITYRVEIGVEEKYGVFASSSPFCKDLDSAFREATLALLYDLSEIKMRGQRPNLVCWQRRRM